jgi:uncharacterized repeat protein (TIGR01451 family)
MANTIPKSTIESQFYSAYASTNADYGPWSSISEYMSWHSTTGRPSVLPGTLIAIHNQTTDEVTLKIYSKGEWVDVCSGNHDDEESDDPSPTPPDPQPPETVTLVSIAVSGQTTSYQIGDTFSFDGTCTATYSDDSQQTVTPTSVSTPSMSTSGSKTITVSYTENGVTKTAKYTISVAAPVVKTASFTAIINGSPASNVSVGNKITYTVSVQNAGNVALKNGSITGTISKDFTKTFSLGVGDSVPFSYEYTVTQADVDSGTGFIYNKITISAQSAESGVANPTDIIEEKSITTIAASPSLTITKSANTSAAFTITTGTNISYTITVKNTGNVTLTSGTIIDSKFKDFNNTFSLLAPGKSKDFTYTYTVTQDDVNAGNIVNTATASNIISARGINPNNVSVTKTIIIPDNVPFTPAEHEYVNMGFMSGTLWATTNIGAEDPADLGDLFAWGELQPKETYTWNNYAFGTKSAQTKYCVNTKYWAGEGSMDNKILLDPEDDVATQLWGPDWRMPTSLELQELFQNGTSLKTYVTKKYNGVKVGGVQVYTTDNKPGIFVPISILDSNNQTGNVFYWSSENVQRTNFSADALLVYMEGNTMRAGMVRNQDRCVGMFIRPVYIGNK